MNNISLIGMAGCGKSTVGSAISEKFNLSYIDTDHLIEKKFQMTLEDIKKRFGYKFVRSSEEEVILNINSSTQIISTGGSAVYSSLSMKHLKSFSKIIYIDTPLATIVERIDIGQERGLAVPDGVSISDIYSERKPLYEEFSEHIVDGSKSIDEIIADIQKINNE
ncbi:MAG: shikimate kinase [Gammaproteobacteria bacterium]|nr:MAG: shikimate kinase [Gammaproteobacteria bacterium TMED234]|tara:strand:- start:987 stop:1481 length:495 start_codon:yes stop_codon:yes gene_type:complete